MIDKTAMWWRILFPAGLFGLGFCVGGQLLDAPTAAGSGRPDRSLLADVERERAPAVGQAQTQDGLRAIEEALRELDGKMEGLKADLARIASSGLASIPSSAPPPLTPEQVMKSLGAFGHAPKSLAQRLDLDEALGERVEADLEEERNEVAERFRAGGVTAAEWEEYRRIASLGHHRMTAEEEKRRSDLWERFQAFQEGVLRNSPRFHYLSLEQRERVERYRGGHLGIGDDGSPEITLFGPFAGPLRNKKG